MKTLYNGTSNPVVSRILYKRRALGITWTFRVRLRASHWRTLAWPIPLHLTPKDNE